MHVLNFSHLRRIKQRDLFVWWIIKMEEKGDVRSQQEEYLPQKTEGGECYQENHSADGNSGIQVSNKQRKLVARQKKEIQVTCTIYVNIV